MCISVRVYLYISIPFILSLYSRRAVRRFSVLRSHVDRSRPRGSPADPGGSVSEFEKISGIISSTKGLDLVVLSLSVGPASHSRGPTLAATRVLSSDPLKRISYP